jgi:hypothetical protein
MQCSNRWLGISGIFLLGLAGCQAQDAPLDEGDDATGSVAQAAQACDATCTRILQPASFVKLDGNATSVPAGSRVCLAAGNYEYVRLEYLRGTASAPITVINCGGRVTIGNPTNPDASKGFVVHGSSHVKLTGTGDSAQSYGFKIDGTVGSGLSISGKSTDVEVERWEIANTGFAGIMAKTDPTCDGTANRGAFTQYNTRIHDNYIHDTEGEGLYIGHSFYDGYDNNSSCPGTVLYPHDLVGLRIYKNRLEDTWADGIQVGCAVQDVEVYDNTIEGYGIAPFQQFQNSGIQIGGGTTGKWYNNHVHATGDPDSGGGFSIIGQGDLSIFNNVVVQPPGGAMYINYRVPAGSSIAIQNNDIIRPAQWVLKTPNDDAPILFRNNIVVTDPGVPTIVLEKTTVPFTQSNNLMTTSLGSVGFVNPAADDYHITASSPARNAGANASSYFSIDFERDARSDGTFDIGADEYKGPTGCPVIFSQDFSSSTVVSNYVGSDPGDFDDISAEVDGGTWSISGGRLVLNRTGASSTDNDAGLTLLDFPCSPTVLHVSFSLAVSGWSASQYQTGAVCFDIGSFTGVFDYTSGGALGNVFNGVCVKGQGPNSFTLSTEGVLASTNYPANGTAIAVSYFLNKSGAAKSYKGPDGVTRSLAANSVSVWAGSTLLLDNIAASNGSSSALTDLRVRWGQPEDALWSLDDLVIRAALPQ